MANASLSHRSSHQRSVTRSPNHWWEISWKIISSRRRCAYRVTARSNTNVSAANTQAAFSMAPKLNSGTKHRSSFRNGYGVAKASAKNAVPAPSRSSSTAGSRCAARERRECTPRGTAPAWSAVHDAHGPAAIATTYVLIGGVGANLRTPGVLESTGALDRTVQPSGVVTLIWKGALRSGWSKQANTRGAWPGCRWLYTYTCRSAGSVNRCRPSPPVEKS
ncbi:hypothetical protein OG320_26860 [Microbispora sp. NBC_01189]|nr:hypothetical protein OG320_26860 [Microbispora sp. NBC_01189]